MAESSGTCLLDGVKGLGTRSAYVNLESRRLRGHLALGSEGPVCAGKPKDVQSTSQNVASPATERGRPLSSWADLARALVGAINSLLAITFMVGCIPKPWNRSYVEPVISVEGLSQQCRARFTSRLWVF